MFISRINSRCLLTSLYEHLIYSSEFNPQRLFFKNALKSLVKHSFSYLSHRLVRRHQCISFLWANQKRLLMLSSTPRARDWFKLSPIQPIHIAFGLLNHYITCFFGSLSERSRLCMKQTHNNTHAWEKSPEKDITLAENKPKTRIIKAGTYRIKHWSLYICIAMSQ